MLAFEREGVVSQVYYEEGDAVAAGAVIAELNADILTAEIGAQRSQFNREMIRLDSFINGPELYERVRVRVQAEVAEQEVKSETRLALVAAQQKAIAIEGMVYTELDSLFSGTVRNPRFEGDVSVLTRQRINKVRKSAEGIFARWREWSNIESDSHETVLPILEQFEKDLRVVYGEIVGIYDVLLSVRSVSRDGRESFALLAKVREQMFNAIATVVRDMSKVHSALRKYNVTLAQSVESLAGGTLTDQLAQSAQVTAELERLRGLNLQVGKTVIRAPFSGVVGEIFVREGEFAQRGTDVVRFVSDDGFNVSVDVTEVEVQKVAVDQKMPATVVATGENITVCIRGIDVTESRINDVPVYTITFDVTEGGASLRSGMTVDVHIPSGSSDMVITVPTAAIIEDDDDRYVVVQRPTGPMVVQVTVGDTRADGTVVVSGDVRADDTVILNN